MRDGLTRKLEVKASDKPTPDFLKTHCITLVIAKGPAAGQEFSIEQERVVLGRGPTVDLAFDDPSMSREHAALELTGEQYRVRDLASTNGVVVNGSRLLVADLKHGDTIEIGEHEFRWLVEAHSHAGGTYVLGDD
jgi:pSer/pThr/pTyr-binding forkhead associated (FHA) protein